VEHAQAGAIALHCRAIPVVEALVAQVVVPVVLQSGNTHGTSALKHSTRLVRAAYTHIIYLLVISLL
jgi:chorismate synthase